jgi:competence protein ComEC
VPYTNQISIWKQSPFIRLLVPVSIGLLIEWYAVIPLTIIIVGAICFSAAIIFFRLLPMGTRFKLQPVQGICINLVLISFGLFITWQKDIRHDKNWFGNNYHQHDGLIIRMDEPLIEKAKSYKTNGYVEAIIQNDKTISCKGKLLVYFSKDFAAQQLHYGDRIFVNKNIQLIKNAGNPGEFNYEQYAIFHQTLYNVFLKEKDWSLLNKKYSKPVEGFIFSVRQYILLIIRRDIGTNKNISAVAEALLIGYTNDLDKETVQAYTNTGVVHIISLSGMHLGLLYLILIWVFNKIPIIKTRSIIKVVAILSCLWLFAFLTGASASVFRSAIVFSCLTIGNGLNKKSPVYNSLAASAFILLCYDPYFLWDIGFQLSYLAVLSIIIFQQHIYHWLYIQNKWLDKIWRLMAITLAAQILTFPICIYYFHQFPVFFLVTNLIAIPLSTIILFTEVLLLTFGWIPFAGYYIGKVICWLTGALNYFIFKIDQLPFSVINNLSLSFLSACFLYLFILFLSAWFIHVNKRFLYFSLTGLLLFVLLLNYNNWIIMRQKEMIVYNVPQHQSIDFVEGNSYHFVGDSLLLAEAELQDFHCKPSRLLLRLNKKVDSLSEVFTSDNWYQFDNKRILLIDKPFNMESPAQKINVDIIIISKSPKLSIAQLTSVFNCGQYIFDASNSLWKIDKWKKDCDELLLHYYSVPDQGAFVYDINRSANTNY